MGVLKSFEDFDSFSKRWIILCKIAYSSFLEHYTALHAISPICLPLSRWCYDAPFRHNLPQCKPLQRVSATSAQKKTLLQCRGLAFGIKAGG